MFRREGPAREARKNIQLAAYLAAAAGFVNSGGFVLIGSFTSHVTGSIGRIANDIAEGHPIASVSAALLVLAFFVGAFIASVVLESTDTPEVAKRYALALALEAALLASFIFVAGLSRASHPRVLDAQAALLCAAMGMQNSLVTRLSGAVVRTTHLTGVVTDLGIEAARWYRWHRAKLSAGPGAAPNREPPSPDRTSLLLAVVLSFIVGAVAGAVLTSRASRWAMCLPVAMIVLASAFAFSQASATRTDSRA
jgi:uncharacterized membrane protein YoaK (UPF0700 family)